MEGYILKHVLYAVEHGLIQLEKRASIQKTEF